MADKPGAHAIPCAPTTPQTAPIYWLHILYDYMIPYVAQYCKKKLYPFLTAI